jgi:ATP-dependent DNA helicase DinG
MPVFSPHTQLRMEEIFGPAGPLVTRLGMSQRKSQMDMVYTITTALSQDKGCIIEASTGSGKSLGYLFPAAEYISSLQARGMNPRVIISTASKGLQDQLVSKDFKLLTSIYPNLTCRVLKGLMKAGQNKKRPEIMAEAQKLLAHQDALGKLALGTREEVQPYGCSEDLWPEICGGNPCCSRGDTHVCFKKKAYRDAKDAHILSVNHTFLAFLALFTPSIHPAQPKPEETLLIIDEGHELLSQIRSALNKNFSLFTLKQLIHSLQNAETQGQLLGRLEAIVDSLCAIIPPDESLPIRHGDTQATFELGRLAQIMTDLSQHLRKDYEALAASGFYFDEKDAFDAVLVHTTLARNANFLKDFLRDFPTDTLFEIFREDRRSKFAKLRIQYRPFSYEKELQHIYAYSSLPPIITSATIINTSAADTLREFCLKPENMLVKQISSEFDYINTIRGFVFPDIKSCLDPMEITPWLRQILPLTHGNALILFTNRQVMENVYYQLLLWGKKHGYNFMLQQETCPPNVMSATMKARSNCVLFGLKSLWTGIDIKGKNLSSVIITKLPFDPPDNFSESYGEYLRKQGLHPFYNWSLPEMINRFRQGIGRLKRDQSDKGLIFILDPRFVSASYKNQMVGRLPLIEWTQVRSLEDLPSAAITEWLEVEPPPGAPAPPKEAKKDDTGEDPF